MWYFSTLLSVLVFCQFTSQTVDKTIIVLQHSSQHSKENSSNHNSVDDNNRQCGVFPPPKFQNQIRSEICLGNSSCPPWFLCENSTCRCRQNHHRMVCCDDEFQRSAVLDCYCITFNEKNGETVAGACFYNCQNTTNNKVDTIYHLLPENVSELNKVMCGYFNRTGPLCGECVDGSFPLAYSYNMSCVYCPDGHKNWWKFILVAFVPLTFFYFFVLFFKINATSSHFHGYVLLSQVVSTPVNVRILLRTTESMPQKLTLTKTLISFYGIWNLDFFRTVIPNICLQTNTLQTLALDYAVAVYPLFLMIISYVFIELHDQNFRIVVLVWKPFRLILTFFRRNWDSRTSVIDAYATFFLLSSMKFLSVSFDLLIPAHLYKLNSDQSSLVLYYDGSIEYFGKEHLPYAILAIIILIIFILLPILVLFFYPFAVFQKLLNCFPIRWYILRTFVDSFQGCYKDGTEQGTHDCRWFSAIFIVWRVLPFAAFTMTLGSAFIELAILLYVLLAILLVTVQPFKARVAHFNKINVTFVLLIVMFLAAIAGINVAKIKEIRFYEFFTILACVGSVSPLLYVTWIVVHWIMSQRKWGTQFLHMVRAWKQGYNLWELEEPLPDRLVNPADYHEGNLSSFSRVLTNKTH